MATPIVVPKMNVDEGHLRPWERKVYTLQQEHKMYCHWATHLLSIQQLDIAEQYYNKALQLNENEPETLYFRSVSRRKIAHIKDALEDALKANELCPYKARNNLAIGNALAQLNQFENALIEYYYGRHVYTGSVIKDFLYRISVIKEQLTVSLGDLLQDFFLKDVRYNSNILEIVRNKGAPDTIPLWKKLRNEEKCDVLSILEKHEVQRSPRELARRERMFRIFNQNYLKRGWIDAIFLHKLRNNERTFAKAYRAPKTLLINLLESKYQMVKTFLKMLQARKPLYIKNALKYPNKKLREHHITRYLNGVQYQTRRNMFIVLRQVKQLRSQGKIEELARYIEDVMGSYVVLKTYRVMPWKFEFMNDVYNTLALAYTDRYTVNKHFFNRPFSSNALLELFKISTRANTKRIAFFEFGKKSTSVSITAAYDTKADNHKKFLARSERRILFSKYPIEKAYLRYEMARAHLKQNSFSECHHYAKMAIEESKNSGNNLWTFLSQMLIVNSFAATNKLELCSEAINEAYNTSLMLGNERLFLYLETARQITEEFIANKQRRRSIDTLARKRKYSNVTLDSDEDPSM